MEHNNIIVICTGNTCRSPMAKGIIEKLIADNKIEGVKVDSMGLSAFDGDGASQYAIDALNEIGIDISTHRSKSVMLDDIINADSIYVMTIQHKLVLIDACPEIENKIIVMDIPDPFNSSFAKYQQCRDAMIEFFNKELGLDG